MFFEDHPERYEKVDRVVEGSPFHFRRADIARQLDAARPNPDGFHGPRIVLDAPSMPSIGLSVERLPAGTVTRSYCSTANQIFLAMAETGDTVIGGPRFPWKPGDTLAASGWYTISHHATSDAQLFVMSDEPLL
jgi:gentisate 1,2-dioxygenase